VTFHVNVTELRRHRVTYVVEAADAAEARLRAMEGHTVDIIDTDGFADVEDRLVGRALEVPGCRSAPSEETRSV